MNTLIGNLKNKPESVHFIAAITYYRWEDHQERRGTTNLHAGSSAKQVLQSVLDEVTSEYDHQYTRATAEISLVCSECNGQGRIQAARRGSKPCPVCKGIGSDPTI
jgi:DnaJ-class molecular chaperone